MVEQEVISRITAEFREADNEVHQGPDVGNSTGRENQQADHHNTKSRLATQETMHAEAAKEEAQQDVKNLANFAVLSRCGRKGAERNLLLELLRLLELLGLLRLLELLGLLVLRLPGNVWISHNQTFQSCQESRRWRLSQAQQIPILVHKCMFSRDFNVYGAVDTTGTAVNSGNPSARFMP